MARAALHLGYSLSTEEHRPEDLVRFAQQAEAIGFEYASISDHFHPWLQAQGNSPFAWTVIGAIANATTRLELTTGVTCPTMRYHPAIVAQAAATAASLMPGRFSLGVGTGENLNEHIIGTRWPPYEKRAAMLEEAVEIIRALWAGDVVDYAGTWFTVENARLYTLPEETPPLLVAATGPQAAELAGRIGDGLFTVAPDPRIREAFDATKAPKARGAKATARRPHYLQVNVCWAKTVAEARRQALEICGNVALPGELGNELPTPSHYEAAVKLISEDDAAKIILPSNDPEEHVARIQAGLDAGYEHIHIYQVGPDQAGFFRFYEREVMPRLA
jgi:G6PDH family F420-dependent oxidoreductase